MNKLTADPAHDVTGNGSECHYDLARQLEMRGYEVRADYEDNEHSEVWLEGKHVGDINGDAVAIVTSLGLGTEMNSREAVANWIESVNETTTQLADIRDELEAAWRLVFKRELSEEDAETQRDAWSHLCSAVL